MGLRDIIFKFINHNQKSANVQFRSMKRNNAHKRMSVAIVAIRNIKQNEELLVDYGDIYHKALQDDGELC